MIAVAAAQAAGVLAIAGALAAGTGSATIIVPQAPAVHTGSAATLILRTVPAINHEQVVLDGVSYRTDASGSVAIPTLSGWHRILLRQPRSPAAGSHAVFSRWLDGIALPGREIAVPPGAHVQEAGFIVSRPFSIRFTDNTGQVVPRTDVTRISLTDGTGGKLTFNPARLPRRLPANRIVRNSSGLVPLPLRYSVRAVVMDDSDVVFNGSQEFTVRPGRHPWTVKVLLYPLGITVRDALFGFPVGNTVRLTLPNGTSQMIPLTHGHAVEVNHLPRGSYALLPRGPGLGLSAPVVLSNPQSARLLLLSWVDIAAVLAFAAVFLIGLPLAGGRIVRRPGRARLPVWRSGHTRAERAAGLRRKA